MILPQAGVPLVPTKGRGTDPKRPVAPVVTRLMLLPTENVIITQSNASVRGKHTCEEIHFNGGLRSLPQKTRQ